MKTVLLVAIQLLHRIERIHETGLVYRSGYRRTA